jgi:glycosyltransferase involved in cell wall biosynthesis
MKILMLSDYWPVVGNAVTGLFVKYQAREYARQGHDVEIIAPVPWGRRNRQRPTTLNTDGVKLWSPRFLWSSPQRAPSCLRGRLLTTSIHLCASATASVIDREIDVDAVRAIHVNGLLWTGLALPLIRRRQRKRLSAPIIVTVHGVDPLLCSVAEDKSILQLIRAVWQEADLVTVCGGPLRAHVEHLGAPMSKVHVVPVGNDAFAEEAHAVEAADALVVISVANLNESKAIDVNLRAVAQVIGRRGPQTLRYWIVGDGPERERLIELVRTLRLEHVVTFFGRLTHDQTLDLIARAGVLSVPSYVEAFGIVYLEGMAAGKPVIGCRGTGAEDTIRDGETGFLVPQRDPGAVAQALERLLDDAPLRRSMGQAGRRRARQFTWRANVQRHLNLFESVAHPISSLAVSSN